MILDYNNPKQDKPLKRRSFLPALAWSIGIIVLIGSLISIMTPSLGRARPSANRVKCASNLRSIGQAAGIYAQSHGGNLPSDLITLFQSEDLTAEVFICPSSDHDHATGTTPAQLAGSMLDGDHLSYVWTGTGLTTKAPADVILAFDYEMHHAQNSATTTGMNVLYADGSVDFVNQADAKKIWAQFISGIRPVRMPSSKKP